MCQLGWLISQLIGKVVAGSFDVSEGRDSGTDTRTYNSSALKQPTGREVLAVEIRRHPLSSI